MVGRSDRRFQRHFLLSCPNGRRSHIFAGPALLHLADDAGLAWLGDDDDDGFIRRCSLERKKAFFEGIHAS